MDSEFDRIWRQLAEGKSFRDEFARQLLKHSVAFQIRTLRKQHCGTQRALAERSGLAQGVVSRAEDEEYGNLTLNTCGRIGNGLDMVFLGRYASFSEAVRHFLAISENSVYQTKTFEEEQRGCAPATRAGFFSGSAERAFGGARPDRYAACPARSPGAPGGAVGRGISDAEAGSWPEALEILLPVPLGPESDHGRGAPVAKRTSEEEQWHAKLSHVKALRSNRAWRRRNKTWSGSQRRISRRSTRTSSSRSRLSGISGSGWEL